MKLELDVLASTCIRRKKPWPRLAFVGHVSNSFVDSLCVGFPGAGFMGRRKSDL